jgi:hypothetical protein
MLTLFRWLLRLYPPAYRLEFGDEMMSVLTEVELEEHTKRVPVRTISRIREAGGLLCGAMQEHLRSYGSLTFSERRLAMRSEFRFPKAAVLLMTIILGAILVAIDRARAIQASVPYANPHVGPIKSSGITVLPTLLVVLLGACFAGVLGWAVVFALHRSGTHRFAEVNPSAEASPKNGLSFSLK